jgi:hypothetical protein
MKVVGMDKIKLFRNLIFQKSVVIFTGYQHLRRLFFSDFDMSKKSKITKSLLWLLLRWTVHPPSGKLPIAGLRSKKKNRAATRTNLFFLENLFHVQNISLFGFKNA